MGYMFPMTLSFEAGPSLPSKVTQTVGSIGLIIFDCPIKNNKENRV